MIITDFDEKDFLRHYWQKKPCVIRNFCSDFQDPIDEHDLAGLAQELDVDSRIVRYHEQQWQVETGPFEDFSEHCVGLWSLMVQGVDKHIEDLKYLTQAVNFLPDWRLDDVMVSYSVEGAGVGAHIDEYDVFIVQGKGTRRWQVGLPQEGISIAIVHPLLKQIDGFEALIDVELQSGDAVYIPPLHPHNGVALEACLNYSIGFRAPTNLELLFGLLDEVDLQDTAKRYTDPDLINVRDDCAAACVSSEELSRLQQALVSLLHSAPAEQAILKHLSRQNLPDYSTESRVDVAELIELSNNQTSVFKAPGLRPLYSQTQADPKIFEVHIDGTLFKVPSRYSQQLIKLIGAKSIELNSFGLTSADTEWWELIADLLERGYWYL